MRRVAFLFLISATSGFVQDLPGWGNLPGEGGGIETRVLEPGQLSVIVPDGHSGETDYFHGAKALEDTRFWTMGSKI